MAQQLPVSNLVNVEVSISEAGAAGRNFGDLLILGDSNVISGLQRIEQFNNISQVASLFGTTAPEYLAALDYFDQSPTPQFLSIGRWLRTATAGLNQGAILNATQSALSNFTSITSGGFDVSINGSVLDILGLNFSTALTLNGVASSITTGLSGYGVCTWNGLQFQIASTTTGAGLDATGEIIFSSNPSPGDYVVVNGVTIPFEDSPSSSQVQIGLTGNDTAVNLNTFLESSVNPDLLEASYSVSVGTVTVTFNQVGTIGDAFTLAVSSSAISVSGANLSGGQEPSSVSYLTSPASGQDISTLLGMTAALALPLVPGYAAETALQAVVALDAISTAWYGLTFGASVQPSDSQNLAIAAFIEADAVTRFFGITITNTNVLSSEVTNDLASLLMAEEYKQTFTQYCSTDPYAVCSIFGRLFTVDFNAQNTMINVMYKQEPGILPENLTQEQANTLQAKNCNVYVQYNNDSNIIQYGTVAAPGIFLDEIFSVNWFQNTVQTAVFNALYTTTTKIPQTDQGMGVLVNAVSQVCQQAVTNGIAAPGVWNAAGFGSLNQGDTLKLGYYVYAEPVALQSESDRAARQSVPIQAAVKFAGAVNTVDVLVTFNP